MSMVSIRRGDTLGKLVSQYNRRNGTNLTVAQVAQANGIRDPNKIQAGTKLIFPDAFERNARQQVIRNGQGDRMVRNGVNESVTIRASDEPQQPVTTDGTRPSSQIQLRPQLPLPQPPTRPDPASQEQLRQRRLDILP